MINEDGEEMDLKTLEQEELKEETASDLSKQTYGTDAEALDALTVKNEGEEDDIPEAAEVVGVDDEYGEDE